MMIGQSGGRMDLHSFVEQAGAWLAEHAEPRPDKGVAFRDVPR